MNPDVQKPDLKEEEKKLRAIQLELDKKQVLKAFYSYLKDKSKEVKT